MIILIKDDKIIGTALDAYTGPEQFIPAPEDFDINKLSEYIIVDGEVVYPAADIVRKERTRLLSDCDWTQVADAPVDKEAWAIYRQELRDITAQEGFPDNVVYPTKPE
jgi:hypothetical protein